MSTVLPWYKWYPNDWFGSPAVHRMTVEEQGAYRNLLDWQWQHPDCLLPGDDESMAMLSGLNAEWPRHSAKIMVNFETAADGRRFNAEMKAQWDAGMDLLRRKSEGGKKGMETRRRGKEDKTLSKSLGKTLSKTDMSTCARLESGLESEIESESKPDTELEPKSRKKHTPSRQDAETFTGLPGFEEATEKKKTPAPASRRETWLTPFLDLWARKTGGGQLPPGKAGKYLAPLVKIHGVPKVGTYLSCYLDRTDHQYLSLPRFSETFGSYDPDKPPVQPGRALGHMTMGE